jgi:hypothetical protein
MTAAAVRVAPETLPSHAVIRHFHVDRVYHRAGVHDELVRAVLDDVFSSEDPPTAAGGPAVDDESVRKTENRRHLIYCCC